MYRFYSDDIKKERRRKVFEGVCAFILFGTILSYMIVILLSKNPITIFLANTLAFTLLPILLIIYGIYNVFNRETIRQTLFWILEIGLMVYLLFALNITDAYRDIPYALSSEYAYVEGRLENLTFTPLRRMGIAQTFTIKDIPFEITQSEYKLYENDEDKPFQIQYLPHTKYILQIRRK